MKKLYAFALASTWALSACVMTPHQQQTTALGAVLGGAVGTMVTQDARGTVNGALLGGVLGSVVGANQTSYRPAYYGRGPVAYRPINRTSVYYGRGGHHYRR